MQTSFQLITDGLKRIPIRSQAMAYLQFNRPSGQLRSESLPSLKNSPNILGSPFAAFQQERSTLGKLMNDEFLQKEIEFYNGIQERRNLSMSSYVPPNHQINIPLHKSKISLTVAPSPFHQLVKKNGIFFFERGKTKHSTKAIIIPFQQINKKLNRLNYNQEDLQDINGFNTVININNSIINAKKKKFIGSSPVLPNNSSKGISKRNSGKTMSYIGMIKTKEDTLQLQTGSHRTQNDQTMFSRKSSFSHQSYFKSTFKGKRTQALIQKVMLEDKAVDDILIRKGLKQDRNGSPVNQKKLQHLIQQQDRFNFNENGRISSHYELSQEDSQKIQQCDYDVINKQYIESEEYLLKFFNLNLNVQQKSEHYEQIKQAKKIKLPHLQLTSNSINPTKSPPIGFYNPQFDFTKKRRTQNVFFSKDKQHDLIQQSLKDSLSQRIKLFIKKQQEY